MGVQHKLQRLPVDPKWAGKRNADNGKDVNEKLINNIISYFSEMKITEQFKSVFLSELKNDPNFQEKLKTLLDSDAEAPGDEILWKKIIEADVNLLPQETREKLFKKFEELLHKIFQSTEAGST